MKSLNNVGWIGLGKMGLPMAANILESGNSLLVYNRSRDRADPLISKGATFVPWLAKLGAESGVVFSMVADDQALLDVTLGRDGCFHGMSPGATFVDMSTVSPRVSAQVAEHAMAKGIAYLRAPVSGSIRAAEGGALTILASGPKLAFDAVHGLLTLLGKSVTYLGTGDEARYLKLSINLMVGITAGMMGEALTLSSRGGVDWRQMLDVINNSAVASPLVGYKKDMLLERNFAPMFTVNQMAKDLDLALDTARESGVMLPIVGLVRQMLCALQSGTMGEQDFFSYVTLMEEFSGVAPAYKVE